jgi:hypothetical protein
MQAGWFLEKALQAKYIKLVTEESLIHGMASVFGGERQTR